MEIVSYGHIKPKEIFCGGCGATLRYLPRNVKARPSRPEKTYINCPVCGKILFVDPPTIGDNGYKVFKDNNKEEQE